MGQDTEQESVLENARTEAFNMNMSHVIWAVVQVTHISAKLYAVLEYFSTFGVIR